MSRFVVLGEQKQHSRLGLNPRDYHHYPEDMLSSNVCDDAKASVRYILPVT